MKNIFILICLAILLSSCSATVNNKPTLIEDAPTPPPERKALFTETAQNQASVTLNFASEPFPLKRGYVRLVGVVNSKQGKVALLEIGGRGLTCKTGDMAEEYIISSIKESEVILCIRK